MKIKWTVCVLLLSWGILVLPASAYDDVCADANDDSVVDIRDALMILRHSVELPSPCVTNLTACDVNGTGLIDVIDALDTLRQVVGYLFEMNCPFPVVLTLTGATPIGGLDFLLTYPADKSAIIGNCDFGAGAFGTSASNPISSTQTRVAMIGIPSVVLPADVTICEGYGHFKTFQVSDVYAFDDLFFEVPVNVVVVPNMPVF
jgi:hypothetical protein